MTWALFDTAEDLGDIMLAYEGETAGEVMEKLMRTRPNAVAQDFLPGSTPGPVRRGSWSAGSSTLPTLTR